MTNNESRSRHARILAAMERAKSTQRCIILDVSYLAYRAYFAMGILTQTGIGATVTYGVLREMLQCMELFQSDIVAFCFDIGEPLRRELYPNYKANGQYCNRHKGVSKTNAEEQARREVRKQLEALRTTQLHEFGFNNIFGIAGYEADDLIASLCLSRKPNQEFIIVSADNDLYQLLGPSVCIWNPSTKQTITEHWLHSKYGIYATGWADAKAIAGCSTDCIQGIYNIGVTTAAQYLAGRLKPTSMKYKMIAAEPGVWERNIKLTRLPLAGTPKLQLEETSVSEQQVHKLFRSLGIKHSFS